MHADNADSDRLNDLTGCVTGREFTVLNTFGAGFLEQVCENALALEFRAEMLSVSKQFGFMEYYSAPGGGEYFEGNCSTPPPSRYGTEAFWFAEREAGFAGAKEAARQKASGHKVSPSAHKVPPREKAVALRAKVASASA
jgi:hypothetical protein